MRVDAPCLRVAAAVAAALALAACGASGGGQATPATPTPATPAPVKTKAKAPRLGTKAKAPRLGTKAEAPRLGTKVRATAGGVVVTRDPEEEQSFPLPSGTRGAKKAPRPGDAPAAPRRKASRSAGSRISPGAPSDAEIRRELKEMEHAVKAFKRGARTSSTTAVRASVSTGGRAQTPIGAPDVISRVIAGGNAIAKFPYIWGGGHGSFVDSGYDCSGSVSYALAAAGLLDSPLVSGQFAKWGASGPGKWITIYANDGHVFMYVAGLRFDTSGRDGPFGSRWQTAPRSLAGFSVRHPAGL